MVDYDTENRKKIPHLQKVIWRAASDMRLAPTRRRIKLEELVLHLLVQLHDCRLMSTSSNSVNFIILLLNTNTTVTTKILKKRFDSDKLLNRPLHTHHTYATQMSTYLISTTIAIVWRRENGHYILIVRPVVSFHHQLMGSRDKRQPIVSIKLK